MAGEKIRNDRHCQNRDKIDNRIALFYSIDIGYNILHALRKKHSAHDLRTFHNGGNIISRPEIRALGCDFMKTIGDIFLPAEHFDNLRKHHAASIELRKAVHLHNAITIQQQHPAGNILPFCQRLTI